MKMAKIFGYNENFYFGRKIKLFQQILTIKPENTINLKPLDKENEFKNEKTSRVALVLRRKGPPLGEARPKILINRPNYTIK